MFHEKIFEGSESLVTHKTCIIIPVHNEERTIRWVVQGVKRYTPNVIVVDDASTDSTRDEVLAAGAQLIARENHEGKGRALRAAFDHIREEDYDFVAVMDGDGQHHPLDFLRLQKAIVSDGMDVVIGNRMANPASMPFFRKLFNWFFSILISHLSHVKVSDVLSGYKIFRKDLLNRLDLKSSGYEAETEFVLEAGRARLKVGEIPVKTIYGEETSKIRFIPETFRFIKMLWNRNA